eukprot:Blabericola_migrator_1__4672@NODE_246_length_10907_cov_93_324631_g208_i0_p1_GENE_NODE_246_length_10907_cov_93_324631_g208_i0NODE_246_length_10907_cov_93_324631_g208_i0_p1_ORF_typecomplete_len1981_score393_01Spy1/PF11357_8/0_23_NODE_246_length_10907_cov_93_324631_g208_i09226864
MRWFAVVVLLWGCAQSRQINPVSVLLPYTRPTHPDHRVNVTLQAFGGCYQWRVQRPNVVKLRDPLRDEWHSDLEDEDKAVFASLDSLSAVPKEVVGSKHTKECHNTVVVAQYWNSKEREKSWVFADDKETGIGVKCEIYVSPISSFVIETTAKSLTVGGAETLRIRAFDKEGNVFTSLEGLRFEWEIGDGKVVQIASLKNDVYRPSATRRRIHEKGEQSDIILLKGLSSGRTSVKARLLEPGYEDVAPATVLLDIIEPIVAVPSSLYVMPGSALTLGVKVLKGRDTPSMATILRLPNPDFTWKSSDPQDVAVHPKFAKVMVKTETKANDVVVMVSDQRNENNTDVTNLFIEEPQSMRFHQAPLSAIVEEHIDADATLHDLELLYDKQFSPVALPPDHGGVLSLIKEQPDNQKNTWYLPKNRPVLFSLDVLSSDRDSLYLPSNAVLEVSSNTTDLSTLSWLSQNHAMGVLMPKQLGSGFVSARFKEVGAGTDVYKPPSEISTVQRYVVVEPVQLDGFPSMRENAAKHLISPLPIILPRNFKAQFKLIGGSGNYKLSSSDENICSISHVSNDKTNLVLNTSGSTGMATLTISDESNALNFYRIHCLAAEMEGLDVDNSKRVSQYPLSTQSSQQIQIPVRARAKLPVPFQHQAWISRDKTKLNTETDRQTFNACFQDPLHFTQCHTLGVNIQATAANPALQVAYKRYEKPPMYNCGFVEVVVPESDKITSEVTVSVPDDSAIGADSTTLEFYTPISTWIEQRELYKRLGVESKYVSNAPPPAEVDLSSNRMSSSIGVAIGSSVPVTLVGGPTHRAGCTRTVDGIAIDPRLLKVVKHSVLPPSSLDAVQDGTFLVTCLRETLVTEAVFKLTSACAGEDPETETTTLYVGCSLPVSLHLAPDDTSMSYAVQPMPPKRKIAKTAMTSVSQASRVTNTPEQFGTSRLSITCGGHHQFHIVALDKQRRPLLGLSSFHPEWSVYSRKSNTPLRASDAHGGAMTLEVPPNLCNGELLVEALLSFSDFNGLSYLSKTDLQELQTSVPHIRTKLKNFKASGAGHDKLYLNEMMELHITPQPRFVPANISDELLVDNPNWAYRLMSQYGSGSGRYYITAASGKRHAAIPGIVSMTHYTDLKTYPDFNKSSLKKNGTKTVSRVVNLLKPEDLVATSDRNLFDAPLFAPGQNELNMDEILIRSDGPGEFLVHMEDTGLLGGSVLTAMLNFQRLGNLDLQLEASTDSDSPADAIRIVASQSQGIVSELEAGTPYSVEVLLQTKQQQRFSDRITLTGDDKMVEIIISGPKVHLKEKRGKFEFTPTKTGKLSMRAEVSGDRFLSSPSLDMLIHTPLRLIPDRLVLLPGGHTWEVATEGGGSSVHDLQLRSDDSVICETTKPGDSIIRTGSKGSTTLYLTQPSDSGVTRHLGSPNATTLKVTVAVPSRVGFIRDGLVMPMSNSMMSLTVGIPTRLLGSLFTADQTPFTLGHLLLPSGLDSLTKDQSYACKFVWTADNPSVVALLQDEVDASAETEPSDAASVGIPSGLKVTLFPKTTNRIAGNGRVAATILPLSPGSTRLTLNVECLDRNHWSGPFSRWSDTAHVSVFVTAREDGLSLIEDLGEAVHQRVPMLELQGTGKYFSMLPNLVSSTDLSVCGAELSSGYMAGDVIRVLPGSQYNVRPLWTETWHTDMYCDGGDGRLQHQTSSTSLTICKSPSNYKIEKQQDGSLIIDTPFTERASALFVFTSPNKNKLLHVPLMVVHPDELQLIPVTSLRDSKVPLPTLKAITTPINLQLGERRDVKVVLKNHQKLIIPDNSLRLNIINSHRSVVEVRRDLAYPAVLHLIGAAPGCSSLTVSMESYSLVLDAILVCVARPASMETNITSLAVPVDVPLTQNEESNLLWLLIEYFIKPWFLLQHLRVLILTLLSLAFVSLVIALFLRNNGHFQLQSPRHDPAVKSAYVSNWAVSATPSRSTTAASRGRAFPTGTASARTRMSSD